MVVVDDGSRMPVPGAIRRETRRRARRRAQRRARARRRRSWWRSWTATRYPPPDWIERLAGHFDDPTRRGRRAARQGQAARHGRAPRGGQARHAGPVRPDRRGDHAAQRAPGRPLRPGPALRRGRRPDLAADRPGLASQVRPERGRRARGPRTSSSGASCTAPRPRRSSSATPDKLKHVIVRPWPAATLALLAARRPTPRRRGLRRSRPRCWPALLHASGVPVRLAPVWTAKTLLPTVTQFAKLASPIRGRGSLRTHLV